MKTAICLYRTTKNDLPLRHFSNVARICAVLLCVALFAISGCSSGGGTKPTVEGITFTDIDGTPLKVQPTALSIGQGTYINATLTGDTQLLGSNWTAVCGSALPPGQPLPPGQIQDESCGTFTPAHTLSGPIPGFVGNAVTSGYLTLYVAPATPPKEGVVTLYAQATADPGKTATVTLPISGQPISVAFAPVLPSTLEVNASAQFQAVLSNDVTNAGVRWSVTCTASNCGSFRPVETANGAPTTYIASDTSGIEVQITATAVADPTKAAAGIISITP